MSNEPRSLGASRSKQCAPGSAELASRQGLGAQTIVREADTSFKRGYRHQVISSRPVLRIQASFDRSVKSGKRPILDAGHQTMLERIDMDVVQMRSVVSLAADAMLPETALPDTTFPIAASSGIAILQRGQGADETDFDGFDAIGKIIIAGRQGDHAMHMIWQHHPAIDMKRALTPSQPHRRAQRVDMLHQQAGAAFQQREGQEIRSARHAPASIVRHGHTPECQSSNHKAADSCQPIRQKASDKASHMVCAQPSAVDRPFGASTLQWHPVQAGTTTTPSPSLARTVGRNPGKAGSSAAIRPTHHIQNINPLAGVRGWIEFSYIHPQSAL